MNNVLYLGDKTSYKPNMEQLKHNDILQCHIIQYKQDLESSRLTKYEYVVRLQHMATKLRSHWKLCEEVAGFIYCKPCFD